MSGDFRCVSRQTHLTRRNIFGQIKECEAVLSFWASYASKANELPLKAAYSPSLPTVTQQLSDQRFEADNRVRNAGNGTLLMLTRLRLDHKYNI
jgi:hypothetical protein